MATELMIAHRGYSALYPENTMIAFEKAKSLGCIGIEMDVVLSSDNVPYIMHDNTLDRTTDGTGYCYAVTWDYVKGLDAGSWKGSQFTGEKVPSLEEVLDKFKNKNVCLIIELKIESNYAGIGTTVANLIKSKGMESQCRVMSFNFDYADEAKVANPNLHTGLLAYSGSSFSTAISRAISGGHEFINWEYTDTNLTQSQINSIHQNGLKLGVWTVNTKALIQSMVNLSVDWITSDYVDVMMEIVESNFINQLYFFSDWYNVPIKYYNGSNWDTAIFKEWVDEFWKIWSPKVYK